MKKALTNVEMNELLQRSVGWIRVKELSIDVVFVVEALEHESLISHQATFFGYQFFMQPVKNDDVEYVLMFDELQELRGPVECLQVDLYGFQRPKSNQ